jgi:hypothetical protein
MLAGKFPRGRVQSPKEVRPSAGFNAGTLRQHIYHTKENLQLLDGLAPGHYFKHPFLGDFKLKAAIRFMAVHTNHHLHIIDDIIKTVK